MKTLAASLAFAAAPAVETVSMLDWMLDDAAAPPPAASEAATVAAILAMVDLSGKVAAAQAPAVEVVSTLTHKHHALLDGAEGFRIITGKVSKAMGERLVKEFGARRSMRKGGSWSVPADKAAAAFAAVCADTDAGCPVCKLPKSKWGKRCPGKPVG